MRIEDLIQHWKKTQSGIMDPKIEFSVILDLSKNDIQKINEIERRYPQKTQNEIVSDLIQAALNELSLDVFSEQKESSRENNIPNRDVAKIFLYKVEQLNSQMENLRKLIEVQNKNTSDAKSIVCDLSNRALMLSAELHERFVPDSFGIKVSDYPLPKYLPIKTYFSDHPEENTNNIISCIEEYLSSIGFSISDEFPEERGSWWKKWFVKSKEAMTSEEVVDRLKKAERAIELAALDKVQSEVNKTNSEAASNLIAALAGTNNAAIQIGSLLIVKITKDNGSNIHTRQLTNKEMILLESNQSLLHEPADLIRRLEKLSCQQVA